MDVVACSVCTKNKTALRCDLCERSTCKQCSYFIDASGYEFLSFLPEALRDKTFCPYCYNETIEPQLAEYEEIMEKARNVDVYLTNQGKETRLMRRTEKSLKVNDCDDLEEAQMRLAYLAAQKGFNTLVDVNLVSKKVGTGTYKKLVWSGTASPVNVKKKR